MIILDDKLFYRVVGFINSYKGLSRDCLAEMQKLNPLIPAHTLASILSTKYTKKMMMNHGRVKQNRKEVMKRFTEGMRAGVEPGLIISLARQYDVAPALLAKVILEETMEKRKGDNQNGTTKNMIKDMFKDTTLISDPDLAYEIFLCIVFDNMYGPISDVIKNALGVEYEVKLCREVERVGLTYVDEAVLRTRGYDKTPDIKLDTPCAVDGFIVNWIESKAVFADQATHDQYTKEQYLSYWNRFGTGLVIYWFGHTESVGQAVEKRFMVRYSFPPNITLMDPALIPLPKLNLRKPPSAAV